MSQETLTPVLTKRRDQRFKVGMAGNVNRVDRLSRKLPLKKIKFQPWKKWASMQPDEGRYRHAYSWFGEISRIWKLPYRRYSTSYSIKPFHLNLNYQNNISVNTKSNNPYVVQHKQRNTLLIQQMCMLKKYHPARHQLRQCITAKVRQGIAVSHYNKTAWTARALKVGRTNIQQNATPISQISATAKVRQGIAISHYNKTAWTSRASTVGRTRPRSADKKSEIEHFAYVTSNTLKDQIKPIPNDKLLEQVVQQRSLNANKTFANSIRRLCEKPHVVHRQGVSFIKQIKEKDLKVTLSNINQCSTRKFVSNKQKSIRVQQSALWGFVSGPPFMGSSREQDSPGNNNNATPGRRLNIADLQKKQNYPGSIRAKNLQEINTSPVQRHYVYSLVNSTGKTIKQVDESPAVSVITGQTATETGTQSIKHQIEQQINKRLSYFEKNLFKPKRIAREAYQSISRQLVRERERLGR